MGQQVSEGPRWFDPFVLCFLRQKGVSGDMKAVAITVTGLVQGVGFRPHVYRLAREAGVYGTVLNDLTGVTIHCEGPEALVELFLARLSHETPLMSRVDHIDVRETMVRGATTFEIGPSNENGSGGVAISPDMAMCRACENELKSPGDRRYRYPFINCLDCGPRFSIISGLPYDRALTSMSTFTLCGQCRAEYECPDDRRFHAQPVACGDCGPHVGFLVQGTGRTIPIDYEAIRMAGNLLREGGIIGLKGIGGYHLACDAFNEHAISLLRERKLRPDKPLAVMARSLATVRKYCHVSAAEERELCSVRSPIVLLVIRDHARLSPLLAPDSSRLGVMLPYTPLHRLLIEESPELLVMTSFNRSGQPLCYKDEDAMSLSGTLADGLLTHNRPILNPIDDAVVRVSQDIACHYRFGRGVAPGEFAVPVQLPPVLACGAEQKLSIVFSLDRKLVVGNYLCDMRTVEAMDHVRRCTERLLRLYCVEPTMIVHDLHPDYLSTHWARSMNVARCVAVQHHHAHFASCLLENRVRGPAIGVCFDGSGYGPDGTIWGGEVLVGDISTVTRIARVSPLAMPGGEMAVREPWRMVLSWLYRHAAAGAKDMARRFLPGCSSDAIENVLSLLHHGENVTTSSIGRLFDIAAALLIHRYTNTYEGHGACALQFLAESANEEGGPFPVRADRQGALLELNPADCLGPIIEGLKRGTPSSLLAKCFHHTIAAWICHVCTHIREQDGLRNVALSGGVFQNALLAGMSRELLSKAGFCVYQNRRIPCNDGGIAFGQIAVALGRMGLDLVGDVGEDLPHVSRSTGPNT